jgi:Ca-activated chloride channel family protein
MIVVLIGLFIFVLPRFASAVDDLQHQIMMNPHDAALIQQQAQSYAQEKRYADAASYYELAAKDNTSSVKKAEMLANKGACLAQDKHWQESLDAYEHALIHDAQQSKALYNIPILKELLKKQEQSKKEDARKQPKQNDTGTDENKGGQDQGADKKPREEHAQQGDQKERNDKYEQSAEKKTDHGQKENVQHGPQPKDKSHSSNGDKQQQGSQQQIADNKDRSLSTRQEKLQQETPSASAIQDIQKKLHEARAQDEQKQLDAREKVGDQAWRWLSQIDEHERQGQQVLVEYQSKQVQQEHGSKNW